MLITVLFTIIGVIILLLGTGYFIIQPGKGASAFQVGGFILMLILGLMIAAEGIDFTGEKTSVYENSTTEETTITQLTNQYSSVNLALSSTLILLGLFGLFVGVERSDKG